jgi:hypothetical protein
MGVKNKGEGRSDVRRPTGREVRRKGWFDVLRSTFDGKKFDGGRGRRNVEF